MSREIIQESDWRDQETAAREKRNSRILAEVKNGLYLSLQVLQYSPKRVPRRPAAHHCSTTVVLVLTAVGTGTGISVSEPVIEIDT